MSKCQISIIFDRPDRVYFGGETIRGNARITVQDDTQGKGIKLTHFWKTHGRGNTNTGLTETIELAGPQLLMAGDELDLPFEIVAPTHPITYHGNLIYVDHYVRVDVAVPWARDPWSEEEYILRPGNPPPQMTGQRDQLVSLKPPAAKLGWITKTILTLLAVAFMGVIAVFATIMLPVILVIVAIVWIRKTAIAARVGNVEVAMPHLIVAPEEQWPVSIRFTPRKSFTINSITVQIIADESASSGSGSNRTTHKHNLVSVRHVLHEGGLLRAGETVDKEAQITFPGFKAFSFEESDNSIKWKAEVRIDIPRFPDWSKTEALQVVPIEFLGDQARLTDGTTGAARTAFEQEAASWTPSKDEPDDDFRDDVPRSSGSSNVGSSNVGSSGIETTGAGAATMQELLTQLQSVERSNQRPGIIDSVSGLDMDVDVVIDRIVTSIGTMNAEAEYANGKTVTGTIAGTQQTIEVTALKEYNAQLESLRRGDTWRTTVNVVDWDNLYHRIQSRQVE